MKQVSVQNQKGLIVPLIIFIILALGLVGGLYLVKNPNLNIFKSKAASSPIEVKATDGSSFPKEGDVFVVDPTKVSPLSVKLELTSPLGPPAGSGGTSTGSKPFICENYGDLNLDGKITAEDTNMALQISQGKLNPNTSGKEYMRVVGDVDNNEKIDTADAQIIQQYLEGKTGMFPVCASLKAAPCDSLVGDVTGNGNISKIDAQEVLNIVVGNPNSIYTGKPYTEAQKKNADVDLQASGGEKVTSRDSLIILKYLLGETSTFEACTPKPVATQTPVPVQTPQPVYYYEDQNVNEGGN